jgi:hypothetical protein
MLLLDVLGPIDHLHGSNLQKYTFIINAVKEVHLCRNKCTILSVKIGLNV